jgi:hypothetical protein
MDTDNDIEGLSRLLGSPRSGDRLRALDTVSAKVGGRVLRKIDDQRLVPLLIRSLGDADRRVQRAAARGLRPWLADDPRLIDSILAAYAEHHISGGYSHAGLHDTRSGESWVPRFAAVRGHAALLPDANTDRFFKFEFFVPGQAPSWINGDGISGHLILHFIPEWSYARQALIPGHYESGMNANLRAQERYARRVTDLYRAARLPNTVRVHSITGGGGHHRVRELDRECIAAAAP